MKKHITFTQHQAGAVSWTIYSQTGTMIRQGAKKKMPAGRNKLLIDMKTATGKFFAVIKTPVDRIEQRFSIKTPITTKSIIMKRSITLLCAVLLLSFSKAQYVFTELNCNTGGGAEPSYLNVFQNKVIFQATDATNGTELFSSDGTPAGTGLLRDFVLGSGSGNPNYFKEFGGQVFFQSANGVFGYELQSYDGDGQPGLFADIYPGPEGSFPRYFTEYNGRLYFSANDSVHGFELFSTDGVWAHGVSLVKDINPDTTYAFPANLFTCNGKLYFVADDGMHGRELWTSDGTDTGTHLIKDISLVSVSEPMQFTVLNNKFYFQANTPNEGTELWVSDGTEVGTVLLKDINPGTASSNPWGLCAYNNKVYFAADNGTLGTELWCTDGTTVGTVLVKDLVTGATSSGPNTFFVFQNQLFFAANDTSGLELWISDGSVSGTHLFKDLAPGGYSSTPYNFYAAGNKMYFTGGTDFGGHFARQAWVSDGTEAGTVVISPANVTGNAIVSNYVAFNFVSLGNDLFYPAEYNSNGNQLWKVTDTTTAPTSIKDVVTPDDYSLYPMPLSAKQLFIQSEKLAGEKTEVTLLDICGRKIVPENILTEGSRLVITLPDLHPGNYLVQLQNSKGLTVKKLIVL